MRIKSVLLMALAVLVLEGVSLARMFRQESQEGGKARPVRSSLIRMDLLKKNDQPLSPPLRNIFAPHRGDVRPGRPGQPTDPGGEAGEEPDEEAAAQPEEDVIRSAPVQIALRYIGYVRSTERTVAVIMFQGQPLAVHAGEMIEEGVTIVTITPEELVFQGADDVSRTVALEGEDR
jgi:hypothetical protein